MEASAEHILQTALNLPPCERAEIAASLIQSLDAASEADIDAAWADEIRRRIDAIDSGQVTLIPWDQVMRTMRERIDG